MASDPFASTVSDETSNPAAEGDPFAEGDNPEEMAARNYLPFVSMEQLNGHAVVLEPVSFNPKSPVPDGLKRPDYTEREEFRCRLIVLAGAPIELEKTEETSPGVYKKTGEILTVGAGEYAWPQEWGYFTVPHGAMIGLLKEVWDTKEDKPRGKGFRWGTVRRFANKRMPKALQSATPDQIDAYIRDYYAAKTAGKSATEIKPTWKLQTPTAEINKLASAWYRASRAES